AGSLAAVGGITVASFVAAPPSEEAPWLERGLASTREGLSATQRFPKRLLRSLVQRLDPEPQPRLEAAAPILSDPQRQQLQAEATALNQELAQLSQRASAVEQQLGYDYGDGKLEQRLATISQTLANPSVSPKGGQGQPGSQTGLVMTLPTDPLFADEQSALKPGSTTLLGTLLGEMRPYESAIVTIRVHTDDGGSAEGQRDLSLRRAQVVGNYLRSQLSPLSSDRPRFIWNPVGVGNTQPLVPNDSNENRQRNRRIEIMVTPQ
ncbi:MAG: OmpA family protein, partial [Synechococcales cyanobacterium RM1_1_8]|nr:OmpA family protein [Synechococcales cyanobacterium RM1_1_8]